MSFLKWSLPVNHMDLYFSSQHKWEHIKETDCSLPFPLCFGNHSFTLDSTGLAALTAWRLLAVFFSYKKKCLSENTSFHIYISKCNFPPSWLYVVGHPTLCSVCSITIYHHGLWFCGFTVNLIAIHHFNLCFSLVQAIVCSSVFS